MFFFLRPESARLSDACLPLVRTYEAVKKSPHEVYAKLTSYDLLDRELFYRERAAPPAAGVAEAARFLYFNRAGWNGLYRVNSAGRYNVPYGQPKSPLHIDPDNFIAASQLLASPGVEIVGSDYSEVENAAAEGDFVYLDPPYVTGHDNNGFADYNEKLFSWDDQVALAALAARLQAAGVQVVVSNAHHDSLIALYPTFKVAKVMRQSTLAGDMTARGRVNEAVFH